MSVRGMLLLVLVVGGRLGIWASRSQLQRTEVAMVEAAHGAVVYRGETFGPYWGISASAEIRTMDNTHRTGGLVLKGELDPDTFGSPNPDTFGSSTMVLNPLVAWTRRTLGIDYVDDVVIVWYIHSDKVRDADLARLSAFPNMEKLVLDGTAIGDNGLAQLSRLRNLRSLSLNRTRITDVGMDSLRRLELLEDLSIFQDSENLTDAGLTRLTGLKRLRTLEIGGPKITDAGLRSIRSLPHLQYLLVTDARNVSPEGMAELRRTLPHLEIAEQ